MRAAVIPRPWRSARRRLCRSHPAGPGRRDRPAVGHLRLWVRPVGLSGHQPDPSARPSRWVTDTSAPSTMSATTSPPSAAVSSSSARSSPAATAAKSAAPDGRVPASCLRAPRNSLAQMGHRPNTLRVPLAGGTVSSPPRTCPPTTSYPACSPPPTCWAPDGSMPSQPRPAPASPSPPSGPAPSAYSPRPRRFPEPLATRLESVLDRRRHC